jgi:hypothetical protein
MALSLTGLVRKLWPLALLSAAVLAQDGSWHSGVVNASVAANYAAADVVFKGFLQELTEVPQGYKAEFSVDIPIKNAKTSNVVVFSAKDDTCGHLENMKTYLVYAQKIGSQLWADLCNGTKPRSLAESDLKYIHTINAKITPECNEDRIRKLGSMAAEIVTAEVDGKPRGSFPAFWSGLVRSTEDVPYHLKTVIKGHVDQEKFVVEHIVVDNSLTADIDIPRLSPSLFQKGNYLLLFLEPGSVAPNDRIEPRSTRGVGYVSLDEDCGVLPADAEVLDIVSKGIQ